MGPEAIGVFIPLSLRHRIECQQIQRLHGPILHGGDPERAAFAVRFGDVDPSERLGLIARARQAVDGLPFHVWGAPNLPIHAGSPFTSIFSDSFDGQRTRCKRAHQQALQLLHAPPLLMLGCLSDPYL